MEPKNLTLIGVDGGASKVSGWIVNYSVKDDSYSLSKYHAELPYSSIMGHADISTTMIYAHLAPDHKCPA